MGADFCNIHQGDIVAVWGCGGVGLMAQRGVTVRSAQQHGQRYVPKLFEHVQRGELDPAILMTHRMSLEDAPRGYQLFKEKQDGCLRAVFAP